MDRLRILLEMNVPRNDDKLRQVEQDWNLWPIQSWQEVHQSYNKGCGKGNGKRDWIWQGQNGNNIVPSPSLSLIILSLCLSLSLFFSISPLPLFPSLSLIFSLAPPLSLSASSFSVATWISTQKGLWPEAIQEPFLSNSIIMEKLVWLFWLTLGDPLPNQLKVIRSLRNGDWCRTCEQPDLHQEVPSLPNRPGQQTVLFTLHAWKESFWEQYRGYQRHSLCGDRFKKRF